MLRVLLLAVLLRTVWAQAAEPHPSLRPIGSLEGLGVNIRFTDPKPGELEMIAAAGFKWVRMDLTWAGTERNKREYDFAAFDRLAAALDQHKLRAVFILDYGNPLYAEPGDGHPFTSRAAAAEFREAYAKWAVAAVSRYRGKGYLWELWNEPNHAGSWKPKPNAADYVALAKAACEALRAAGLTAAPIENAESRNSGEAVIGPATSTIDLPFLEECFKAGLLEHWAGVSVHPSRPQAPETVEDEYRSLRLLIRRYAPPGKAIPILSGAWGYSTAWPALGPDEAAREGMQARYLARMFLTNLANDVPLSIWSDWRDDGDDPKNAEHRFGLVRRPYQEGREPVFEPKPAYQAAKALTHQLAGFRFNKTISDWPPDPYMVPRQLLFSRGEENRLAAWNSGPWIGGLNCPLEEGTVRRWDYLGTQGEDIPANRREHMISIDYGPSYFVPVKPGRIWRLASEWERAPLEIYLESPGSVSLEASFRNPLPEPVGVTVWPTIESRWAEGDLAYSEVVGAPTHILAPGERKQLHTEKKITGREPDKRIEFWAGFWPGKPKLVELCQPVPLKITNPLSARALPLTSDGLPIEITEPLGRGFKGEVWLKMRRFPPRHYPFEIPAGQTQTVVRIDAAELEKSDDIVPDYELYIRINSPRGEPVFDRKIGLPIRCDPQLIQSAKLLWSGDAEVGAKGELHAGQPDAGASPSGTASMRFQYSIAAGRKSARLAPGASPAIAGSPKELALWVHGDGQGCQARLRFTDSSGQCFEGDGPKIDWKGWRYVTLPMQSTDEKPLTHWDGANTGKINYPIKWDTIFLLDNVSRDAIEGEIYLSAPTLIYLW